MHLNENLSKILTALIIATPKRSINFLYSGIFNDSMSTLQHEIKTAKLRGQHQINITQQFSLLLPRPETLGFLLRISFLDDCGTSFKPTGIK